MPGPRIEPRPPAQKSDTLPLDQQVTKKKITEFQRIADGFIHTVDNLAKEVEKEKIKAIGVRNLLKSVSKQREAEQQQCQALMIEKSMELERLRVQYQSLMKCEHEQQETIEQLVLHR
uniref:(California timema) hypothetical protein n=1 Tax=Timema californicum TaxID=61474 RepID=A0A7R9JGZ8_TIMCA|nr:unnamed protein product [Timema californicum]